MVNLFPTLRNGPTADGEKGARENYISGAPFQTHSGPGFRAELRGDFHDVFVDLPEPPEVVEDSWVCIGSAEYDGVVEVNSSRDPRRSFRRRFRTTTEGLNGWTAGVEVVVPDRTGKGFVEIAEPFEEPLAEIDVFLLGRFGRSMKLQYHITCYAMSIELDILRKPAPAFVSAWVYDEGFTQFRAEHGTYETGSVDRNKLVLKSTSRPKGASAWQEASVTPPSFSGTYDVGVFRVCALRPDRLVLIGCETPAAYPSMFVGTPQGGWTKTSNGLSAAYPGDVAWSSYYATEAAWAAAQETPPADPQDARWGYLRQNAIHYWLRSRGTLTDMYALDSEHVVYLAGRYPTVEEGTMWAITVSVVNVLTGAVSKVYQTVFDTPVGSEWNATLTMLGRDSWMVEYVRRNTATKVTEDKVMQITFDRGTTYMNPGLPLSWIVLSTVPVIPVTKDGEGNITDFLAVLLNNEPDGRRIYSTKDFVWFEREGLAAKAEQIDSGVDFVRMVKLGNRMDRAYINSCFPWANDARVYPPDWW